MRDCFEKAGKYCFGSEMGDQEITIETGSLPAKPGELAGMIIAEQTSILIILLLQYTWTIQGFVYVLGFVMQTLFKKRVIAQINKYWFYQSFNSRW